MTPKRAGGENRPTNGLRSDGNQKEREYDNNAKNNQLPMELDMLADVFADMLAREYLKQQGMMP